jgi:zinc and cadmium transporter
MTLLAIIAATLVAGVGSVWLAALLGFGVLARYTQHMLSLAAGALLATAFMHLLPEAFESQVGAHELFPTLLIGLVFFFLLDKAELWHHGHEHHHGAAPEASGDPHTGHAHDHAHGHAHGPSGGSWAILTGDSVHCFGDGVLIASAFVADLRLGVVAALAVLMHEVPHHMGDLAVLRTASDNRRMAFVKVSLAGALTALGGVMGYFLVAQLEAYLPYFLAIASSSFLYVALADLIPQLQKKLSARETGAQILWLAVGMGMVTLASGLTHSH